MINKSRFSVCPHDTAKNLLGWFTLNTYLQRRLGEAIRFEPQDNFLAERKQVLDGEYQVVYANPYSALCFFREKGFVPVARPSGIVDETVVVAKIGGRLPEAPRIASATDKLIIHSLGLHVLKDLSVDTSRASFEFVGNHLNAAKAVIDGRADIGFVFNETWSGMNPISRASLKVLGESTGGKAFHCFMVAPQWAARRAEIQAVLCTMHEDASGKKVLDDLRFQSFEAVGMEIMEPLAALLD